MGFIYLALTFLYGYNLIENSFDRANKNPLASFVFGILYSIFSQRTQTEINQKALPCNWMISVTPTP